MRRGSSSDLLPQGLGELQDRPASLDGESAEPGVGVDDGRVADRLQECEVGMRIAVRGRPAEVDVLARRDLADRVRLQRPVARSKRPAGEDAVLDLACRSDRTVEAQVVGDALDDLLQ